MEANPNPYVVPDAEVIKVSKDKFLYVSELSVWLVILYTIASFGYYFIFWLVTRFKHYNSSAPERPLSFGFITLVALLELFNLIFSLMPAFGYDQLSRYYIYHPWLYWLINILELIGFFMIRNRLLESINAQQLVVYPPGPFSTFFLTIFYLQHKVNEFKEAQNFKLAMEQ